MILFLQDGTLPDDPTKAKKLIAQESVLVLVGGILYYVNPHGDYKRRAAVPSHLREQLLNENHRGVFSGHFSGPRLYNMLC